MIRIILQNESGSYVFDGSSWVEEGNPEELDHKKVADLWLEVSTYGKQYVTASVIQKGPDDGDRLG